jgi:putative transcriptional regulator
MQMIKNRLKEIRMKEYMMESQQFAKKLEVSNTTYSNWELGVSRPTLEKALEIANKLNRKVDDIWHLE